MAIHPPFSGVNRQTPAAAPAARRQNEYDVFSNFGPPGKILCPGCVVCPVIPSGNKLRWSVCLVVAAFVLSGMAGAAMASSGRQRAENFARAEVAYYANKLPAGTRASAV